MNKIAMLLALCIAANSSFACAARPERDEVRRRPYVRKPLVQIALLLDTSNSMDGLIFQAKTQLWKVVNELARCERNGFNPALQVALYEYGNNNLSVHGGYIRQVAPFTTDLDRLSSELFALSTNGGNEYCGAVIRKAVRGLEWDSRSDVYKAIFIAGNEPFTQGPVGFRSAIREAVGKGIFVNTIFCGNRQEGIATQWKSGADFARGDYMNIDQSDDVYAIQAPQDKDIIFLGEAMNRTFLGVGREGKDASILQAQMDTQSREFASQGAAVERSIFKGKKQYAEGAKWDIVSGVESGRLKVNEVQEEDLPEEIKALPKKERAEAVQKKIAEREDIRKKLKALNDERSNYIREKEKEMSRGSELTLDQALISAVRSQAEKMEFKFPQN